MKGWLGAHTVMTDEDAREWGMYHYGPWARPPDKVSTYLILDSQVCRFRITTAASNLVSYSPWKMIHSLGIVLRNDAYEKWACYSCHEIDCMHAD
jgi:hypothetical protein